MAGPDEAINDAIASYGTRNELSVGELAQRFFVGMWSFPDDIGMALAVSASATGLLGPQLQQNARSVQQNMAMIICLTIRNPDNTKYLISRYLEYLSTDGRWHGLAAQASGRVAGGIATNTLLWRSRRLADSASAAGRPGQRPAPKPGFGSSVTVAGSMFLLATYGAMCRAIIEGRRDFLSLLHAVVTGEATLDLGKLEFNLAYDAPWRQRVSELPDVSEVVKHFQEVCSFNQRGG